MPVYSFKHPEEDIYKNIFMGMNDIHEYFDDNGLKWERIWHKPNAAIDTSINPMDSRDFANKTANKKGENLGNLWDRAGELSQKREKIMGRDEIAVKSKEEAKKLRHGRDLSENIANKNKTFEI